MTLRDLTLGSDDLTVLYPREKEAILVEDIGHHYALTTAAVVSSGRGEAVVGMHKLGAKVIAFHTGEVHKRIITDYFKQYMMKASQEEDCPYYLSRASIIELLGLDPDPAVRETKKENAEEGDTFPCHLLSWASSQE